SLLARAFGDLVGSATPCEFTFMLRKSAEPAGSCFLRPCTICTPVRVYFHASQVRRVCSLVLLSNLPGLLARGSLHSCYASSQSLLARASSDLVGSAPPCEFTFMLRKFAKPAGSCFFRPYRVCSPVGIYFHVSQVRRACWLVLLATLPGLLTRTNLLSRFASSPSLLARASCDLTESAHPCEFTFTLRNSPRLLASASCDIVGSAHLYKFTFMLRKFAESARSCFFRPCRVNSPVRVYFHATQVRRAYWLVLLATLLGLLPRASLLLCFASPLSLLARASCDLAGSTHPC
ncbi:hypothetical protein CRG98_050048, partial [Punica granatum]